MCSAFPLTMMIVMMLNFDMLLDWSVCDTCLGYVDSCSLILSLHLSQLPSCIYVFMSLFPFVISTPTCISTSSISYFMGAVTQASLTPILLPNYYKPFPSSISYLAALSGLSNLQRRPQPERPVPTISDSHRASGPPVEGLG